MTEKELKASVKDPIGGYFFYGDEDYLKEYYTSIIRKAVIADENLAAFNDFVFDNDSFSLSSLEEALSSPPMMSDKKIIRIRLSSYSFIPEKEKKELLQIFSSIDNYSDTVVVFSIAADGFDAGTEKRPSTQLKALQKCMKCVAFPLGQEAKLVRWLARHFAKDSLDADDSAMRLMVNMCGRGMHRLASEAEKVSARALYLGLNKVTCEIVSETVTRTPEEEAFMLANSVVAGDTAAALECLGRAKRRNEPPIKLLSAITSAFCDLAATAHMNAAGIDKYTIAKVLNVHEYKVVLNIRSSAGISPDALDTVVSMCAEADLKSKSLSLGYIPIERLICAAGKAIRKR